VDVSKFQNAINAIVGKWKVEIVCALVDGSCRFGELRRLLPGITQHMLTAQLRELAHSGLVVRTAYAEIPPRVEYELTEAAYALEPVFQALLAWSERYGADLPPKKPRSSPLASS
jgi:DNA-binding HxlR family transcriptional regulator